MKIHFVAFAIGLLLLSACGGAQETTAVSIQDETSDQTFLIDLADGWRISEETPTSIEKDGVVATLTTVPAEAASFSLEEIANRNMEGQSGSIGTELAEVNGQEIIRTIIDQNVTVIDIYQMRVDDETVVTLTIQADSYDPEAYPDELLAMISSIQPE